jgi:hypothetical protein
MVLKLTDKQKHVQAAKDLGKKLILESALAKVLNPHFKSLINKFKDHYKHNGDIPNLSEHKKFIRNTIEDHYIKSSDKFSTQIRDRIGYPKNDDHIQSIINTHTIHDATERARKSSEIIAETTKDNMNNAVKYIAAASLAAGAVLSRSEMAEEAGKKVSDYFDARVPSIATTEVQRASESGKFTEMNALVNGDAYFENVPVTDMDKTKTWVAILDDHTREWHAEADGQEVPFDQPFEVDGEELMEPGDDSMGASPENVINCRCSSIYSIEK